MSSSHACYRVTSDNWLKKKGLTVIRTNVWQENKQWLGGNAADGGLSEGDRARKV